jgi:hypothetical protein
MIEPKPTWNIKDSSKLDTWLDCPRKYFFEHMLGWRVDRPAHDLYFGECWHRAREYQLLNGYSDVTGAYDAFINHYRKEFDVETDELYRPKDPSCVLEALLKFDEERQSDLEENELLYTEVSGTVPVDEQGRALHYRMDSILRRKSDGKIFGWDHKSAKRFSRQWGEKFLLSIQTGTYTHCLYCMYPIDDVIGIEYCGTSFEYLTRGSKDRPAGYHVNFLRVPSWKTPDQMNVWLWNTVDMLDNIEREEDRLMHCKESDAVLMAFPMNPNSCTKYFGCAFHDYCISWSNPLQRCDEPPLGFKVEFWDPREMKTTNKMNLEWR